MRAPRGEKGRKTQGGRRDMKMSPKEGLEPPHCIRYVTPHEDIRHRLTALPTELLWHRRFNYKPPSPPNRLPQVKERRVEQPQGCKNNIAQTTSRRDRKPPIVWSVAGSGNRSVGPLARLVLRIVHQKSCHTPRLCFFLFLRHRSQPWMAALINVTAAPMPPPCKAVSTDAPPWIAVATAASVTTAPLTVADPARFRPFCLLLSGLYVCLAIT